METYKFIDLGGISLKFYQSQNYGTAPGLDTGGSSGVSLKSNHWQNHCTKVANLWATGRSWTITYMESY